MCESIGIILADPLASFWNRLPLKLCETWSYHSIWLYI